MGDNETVEPFKKVWATLQYVRVVKISNINFLDSEFPKGLL
jgi:uncharacterized protein YlbG (UPF0298 family)